MADTLFNLPRFAFDVADERVARAAWSRLTEPADVVAGALVDALGAGPALEWLADALQAPSDAARELSRLELGQKMARSLAGGHDSRPVSPAGVLMAGVRRWAQRLQSLDPVRDLEALDRLDGTLLVPGDPGWPTGLADLGPAAPMALWVRGQADLAGLARRSVSLVGSRASTGYGEAVTRDLAAGLSERRFTIASGGAYGIDAAAHRATLTVRGSTIVLLASGVDRLYPAANTKFMEAAFADGAVVSEVPPGSVPFRQRFLARNRVIAALGRATVVVEAARRSGALSTANHATALARPVGAVPGPVTSMASTGCHDLLRSGAAVCVTDAAEAAELAGSLTTDAAPEQVTEPRPGDDLDPTARRVLDALPVRQAAPIESVATVAGLSIPEVRAKLGGLLITGLAEKEAGRWRRALQGTKK
ncbi:DNA-processing protein DprA [Myceligenerans xiligouense]|uniref:DNA protecting protein DprA n=1 Tax=Myceligenerans xiligouense TaxID=253184 RepID=A0A3N4Z8F3_9MICO|nr:DNA-processing protein DprA [Myceligenerans xiligouense]RPF22148.1 DNA protecting protein DprA [Myceligenerans xiligouense]